MIILVAGGSGFIGTNLVQCLVTDEKNKIIVVDDLSTGRFDNISHYVDDGRITFYECDISQEKIKTILKSEKIDMIYNFASPASPPYYQKDPIQTTKTNVYGIINLLDIAKENGAKLFQSSTSEVYGEAQITPQDEMYWGNVNPIGVRSCYDEGKRCAESLIYSYIRMYHMNVSVARIFNTYGPKMQIDDGRVVTNFIKQALSNEDITIYGSGNQTRSFCYVDDTVDAIVKLMNQCEYNATPVNIGNDHENTILEIANVVLELTKSRSKIVFQEAAIDDPKRRRPNLKLVSELLNWRAKVELYDGITRTIEYFKNIL